MLRARLKWVVHEPTQPRREQMFTKDILFGMNILTLAPCLSGYAGRKAGITSLAKRCNERRLCSGDKAPQAKEQIT